MKECEKWWEKASANYLSDIEVKRDGRLVKVGWRAALECFYDKLGYSIEHKELKDIIEDELEG